MTIYRTRNWGGMEGRDIIVKNYISEETAIAGAKKDTWGNGYELYKVEYVVKDDGRIEEEETYIKNLKSGRDDLFKEVIRYKLINKKGYTMYSGLKKEEVETYINKINKYGWVVKEYTTKILKE